MLKLAVFGHPVGHSLSPRIHAQFGRQCGIELDYRAIDCRAGTLADALNRFRSAGGSGCNLTVPLKSEGLSLAREVSPEAHAAGACNTLVWRDSAWLADNTDGIGLVSDLQRLGIAIAGQRILVVGAGGAVAGVLPALLARGPSRLTLLNRDLARARRLLRGHVAAGVELEAAALGSARVSVPHDLLIQATSLGHEGRVPALERRWLAADAVAYDLNYGRAAQPFLRWCADFDVAAHAGIGMLIEQAAAAFERFTGRRPDTAELHANGIE